MVAGGLDDHPQFEHPVADGLGFAGRRFEGLRIPDHLHPQVEAETVHGSDDGVGVAQRLEPGLQVRTDPAGVVLQALIVQDVEYGHADRARQRAAPGGGEEVALAGEALGHRPAGDHRAERVAVADGLGHRHDVGHRALLLETPEPFAETAVADLHLVGDRQPPTGAHRGVDLLQVAVGQRHAAGVAVDALADESRRGPARGHHRLDAGHRVGGVAGRLVTPVLSAETVRRFHRVHPVGPGGQRIGVVRRRGRHGVGAVRPAVVGLPDRDDVAPAGGRGGQPDRQIACLRTGVDQEHGVQRIG